MTDQERVVEAADKLANEYPECPFCHSTEWGSSKRLVGVLVDTSDMDAPESGLLSEVVKAVFMACIRCGFIRMHWSSPLGLDDIRVKVIRGHTEVEL